MRAGERRQSSILPGIALLAGVLLASSVMVYGEHLPIKTYTTADGLPSTYILSVVRDSRGFLWFCTRDGLSRFDGQRFVTYTMQNGLSNPAINHLLETRSGVYWVATNGGGVCQFNPNTSSSSRNRLFTVFPVGEEPPANRVNILYEDRTGQIWAATDGGLFRLEQVDGNVVFRRVEMGEIIYRDRFGVNAFLEDQEGSLWIGTSLGLVRRLPDGRMIHYVVGPMQKGDLVYALLEDREGRLWIAYREGLVVFKPEPASQVRIAGSGSRNETSTAIRPGARNRQAPLLPVSAGDSRWFTVADGLAHNIISGLYQSADGRVWMATQGGLTEFNGRRFRSYTTAQGLADNAIRSLAEDQDGNLWIGGRATGAMRLALNGLTTYNEADGLGQASISSTGIGPTQIVGIFEDQASNIYAISGNWAINRFDGKQFTSVQPALPADAIDPSSPFLGFLDRTGEWWMQTTKGLYRFASVKSIQHLARNRPSAVYTGRNGLKDVYRSYEDSHGNIWVSTISAEKCGLARWERATEKWHHYLIPDGLSPTSAATVFCEDRSGSLWIGFHEGQLARYAAGRFTIFTAENGVPAGRILNLYLDRAGRIWIATNQGGLGRINDPLSDRPEFIVYTTAQGLSSNNIRCITEDLEGRIYVGTARGLNQIHLQTGQVKHYTTDDGLANDFVSVAFRDRQGTLWFGTLKGLSRFVPPPDTANPFPPPVWIGGLRVAGVTQPISELGQTEVSGMELGAGDNQIQIEFFGLGFKTGERPRYQVMLEGADRDWSAPTEDRHVNYASLQPGTYRFLVRAVSADGTTSPAPAAFAFTIVPPIWQRWWFLTLAAILVGLAAYAIYRYRIARLIELERVRMRIATDLHDDIGSSLSQISVLSEVIRKRVGQEPSVSEPLMMIGGLSRDLVDSLNDIVWAINPRRDRLSDLTHRMRRFASDAFTARDLEFRFNVPDPQHNMRLGADTRREIFLIFKEAVNNLVRHSQCTEADIDFVIKDGQIELNLTDNGKGFDPEHDGDGNGLVNMRLRAVKIGGALDIISSNGRGTTVQLKAPLGRRG
jgi:ligand-binding sensor domain-containing protein